MFFEVGGPYLFVDTGPRGGVSKTLHDPRSIKKRLGLSRVEMTSVTPENDSATQQ